MNRLEQLIAGYAVFGTLLILSAVLVKFRRHRLPWFLKVGLSVVLLVGFIIVDAFFVEPNWLATTNVTITDPALAAATGGNGKCRIVHLSDLHVRPEFRFREKQIVKKVNALQPDLILITGDILEKPGESFTAHELLRGLKARYGVYVVPGNTDYRKLKPPAFRELLESTGVTLLVNQNKRVVLNNGAIWLAGLDDPVHKRDDLTRSLTGIPKGEPVILLSHSPNLYVNAVLSEINLVLAGHTHGGQVGIPWLVRMSEYAYRTPLMRGLFHDGKTTMYVNRGIGTKTFPVRFLCRPEIAVITFSGA